MAVLELVTTESICAACASITDFEQPPCPDGHGPDCPERVCAVCGEAFLVGPLPVPARRSRSRSRSRAA